MRGWQGVTGLAALAAAALSAGAADAEVIAAEPAGFAVEEKIHLAAPPERVWLALGRIGSWWLKEHSYSGDAANLSLGLKAGDCFCEVWAGGSVRHMIVVMALPARMLRLEGVLGPLGGMGASGHLTFKLTRAAGGTDLIATYEVGGWTSGGFAALAGPVDGVLAAQVKSLAAYVECKSSP